MMERYTVFTCCTGDEDDARYLSEFKNRFGDIVAGFLPEYEDSDPLDLSGAQVTVVLIGEQTWRSALIDRQILKSLTPVPRGLMGILLPCYDYPGLSHRATHGEEHLRATTPRDSRFWSHNIPQRFFDNILAEYAVLRPWTEDPKLMAQWIHEAFEASTKVKPAGLERPAQMDDNTDLTLGWKGTNAPAQTFEGKVNLVSE